jgi:hypothetical protein
VQPQVAEVPPVLYHSGKHRLGEVSEMSREAESTSSNKTVLIIVAIVAGVLVVMVAGCFGLGYLFIRAVTPAISSIMQMASDEQRAPQVGQAFLADISTDRLDEAYAWTSHAYQQRQDREAFSKFVAKYPALKKSTASMGTKQTAPARYTIHYTASGPEGSVSTTIVLVKEEDEWKVDQFTIP